VLDATSAAITTNPDTQAGDMVWIGARHDALAAPNIFLDDLMIYPRPLADMEVRALYQDSLLGHPRLLQSDPTDLLAMSRLRVRKQVF
jgi:hypothetical protein